MMCYTDETNVAQYDVRKHSKRVVQYSIENGRVINIFPSMRAAEKESGVPRSNIRRCCNGEFSRAGQYGWQWAGCENVKKKKVFISYPVEGRKIDDAKNGAEKMKVLAEQIFGEQLEPIMDADTYCNMNNADGSVTTAVMLKRLGSRIQKIGEADFFIGCEFSRTDQMCNIERSIARIFGVQNFILPLRIFPDIAEADRTESRDMDKCLDEW